MKGQHFSRSSEVAHLVAEVNRLSVEENLDIYGIEIDRLGLKDNKEFIYDTLEQKYFKTIREWAVFTVEQDAINDEQDYEYDRHDDEDF